MITLVALKRTIVWIISGLDMTRPLSSWPTLSCAILPAPPTNRQWHGHDQTQAHTHMHRQYIGTRTLAGSKNTPSEFQNFFSPWAPLSLFLHTHRWQLQSMLTRESLKSPNEKTKQFQSLPESLEEMSETLRCTAVNRAEATGSAVLCFIKPTCR